MYFFQATIAMTSIVFSMVLPLLHIMIKSPLNVVEGSNIDLNGFRNFEGNGQRWFELHTVTTKKCKMQFHSIMFQLSSGVP